MFFEFIGPDGKKVYRHTLDSHTKEVLSRRIPAKKGRPISTGVQHKKNLMKARRASRQLHRS